jgi:hypothetical protein
MTLRSPSHSLAGFAVLLLLASSVPAQDTNPAALTATITGVEGIVQVRSAEDAGWEPAKIGLVLGEGAEFRTGPRSAVRFVIPPDQTISLDRLGTVKLIEAVRSNQKIKTDLGMKYGRVRYDIEAAGQDHDSTIHSPGSALAVRGTNVSLYDQPPFAPQAVSLIGAAQFRNARKQMIAFGGKAKATVRGDTVSPAQTAMVQSMLSSPVLHHTEQQVRELTFLFAHQGQVFGNVAAGAVPVTDAELPALLSGNLDFVLRWSDPARECADLNLVLNTPKREVFGNPPFILSLFPNDPKVGKLLKENFPQSSPSGGQVGLNHIGPEGIEIASFPATFPRGPYVVGAYNFLYNDKPANIPDLPKVPFTIEVFLHRKRQPLITNFEQVLEGAEAPQFGFVFRDSISIGQLSATAVQIAAPRDQRASAERPKAQDAAGLKHQSPKPRPR